MFRKVILGVVVAAGAAANSGCVNQYSGDPNIRTEQLIYQSEDLRQAGRAWRRLWFNDQPSHLTPERLHGGIVD